MNNQIFGAVILEVIKVARRRVTGENGNLGLSSNIFGLFTTHSFTHSTIVGECTYPQSLTLRCQIKE